MEVNVVNQGKLNITRAGSHPIIILEHLVVRRSHVDHFFKGVLPAIHAGRDLGGDVLPIHGDLASLHRRPSSMPDAAGALLLANIEDLGSVTIKVGSTVLHRYLCPTRSQDFRYLFNLQIIK